MPHTTTCTRCGRAYDEVSDEAANVPAWAADRLCPACTDLEQRDGQADAVETVAATATGRPDPAHPSMSALVYLPVTDDGAIDEAAALATLQRRGVISPDVRAAYVEHVDGWHYVVCDVDSGDTLAGLEVHAGAGA